MLSLVLFAQPVVIAGNLGYLHGKLEIEPEVLVRLQPHALLLDTGGTETLCYLSKCTNVRLRRTTVIRIPLQLNFIFLLNIIRVLVVKLRQSHTSDVEQVRKAVRAAFVLLPLLGITNLLNISQAPLDGTPLEFAVWSYTTHFLTSFQGFFIAMIYCFLNGEVSDSFSLISLSQQAKKEKHSSSRYVRRS